MEDKNSFEKDNEKGNDSSTSLIDKKKAHSVFVTEANGSQNCPREKGGNILSDVRVERMEVVVNFPNFEIIT